MIYGDSTEALPREPESEDGTGGSELELNRIGEQATAG